MKRQTSAVTFKTSTILIAKGRQNLIFGSRAELPVSLRRDLEAALSSKASCRLVIADQRGRERLIRAAADGSPTVVASGQIATLRSLSSIELVIVTLLILLVSAIAFWK